MNKTTKYYSVLVVVLVLVITLADQITKFFVSQNIAVGSRIPLIDNVLYLGHTLNTGAGFGIFQNFNSVLIWVTLIIMGVIVYYYNKVPKETIPQVLIAFILGGALGNFISRIALGHVVDFIAFTFWPSFNVADSFISIGAIGLIIYFWKK